MGYRKHMRLFGYGTSWKFSSEVFSEGFHMFSSKFLNDILSVRSLI